MRKEKDSCVLGRSSVRVLYTVEPLNKYLSKNIFRLGNEMEIEDKLDLGQG